MKLCRARGQICRLFGISKIIKSAKSLHPNGRGPYISLPCHNSSPDWIEKRENCPNLIFSPELGTSATAVATV